MKLSELFRRYFPLLVVPATLFAIQSFGQERISMSSWSFVTIGDTLAPQRFVVSNDSFRVSASSDEPIQTNFFFFPLNGNGLITARISGAPNALATQSGLMIRDGLSNGAKYAWMCLTSNNAVAFERRIEPGENAIRTLETNISNVRNLRLVREGNAFSGFYSSDSTNWVQFSADTVEMGNEAFAGFASAGGETVFDQVRVMSAHLATRLENSTFVVPTNILLQAKTATFNETPRKIEFFSGPQKIGESTIPPFTMEWDNALAGSHALTAKITGADGAEFFTEPANCNIKLPPTRAEFIGVDAFTKGAWKAKYGAEGFHIISHATNYPAYAEISPKGHKSILLNYSSEPSALRLTKGNGGIIGQWFTYSNMTVNVVLLDGRPHHVALYCHDWDSNRRVQQVEVIDSATRAVLDKRRIADFHSGKYFIWNIRGSVRFRITAVTGNAVVSGIFLDANSKQTPP